MPEPTTTPDTTTEETTSSLNMDRKVPTKVNGQTGEASITELVKNYQLEASLHEGKRALSEEKRAFESDLEAVEALRQGLAGGDLDLIKKAFVAADATPEMLDSLFNPQAAQAQPTSKEDESEGKEKVAEPVPFDQLPPEVQGMYQEFEGRKKQAQQAQKQQKLQKQVMEALDKNEEMRIMLERHSGDKEAQKDLLDGVFNAVARRAEQATVWGPRVIQEGLADVQASWKRLGISKQVAPSEDDSEVASLLRDLPPDVGIPPASRPYQTPIPGPTGKTETPSLYSDTYGADIVRRLGEIVRGQGKGDRSS